MLLTHREDNGLPDLPANRVADRILQESPTENRVRSFREKLPLKIALLERLLLLLSFVIGKRHHKTLVSEKLGSHLRSCVNDPGVDQIPIAHPVKQRVAKCRLATLTAEGAVSVEQQPALHLARIAHMRAGRMGASEVVAGRRGQPQLVPDEVIEHSAGVAADRPMRLIRNHQVKVRRRKQRLVLVVEQQRLNSRDHNMRPPPVVAFLLVDDRVKVVRQVRDKRLVRRLIFQLQPIYQEEDAPGVASAEKQLDNSGGH